MARKPKHSNEQFELTANPAAQASASPPPPPPVPAVIEYEAPEGRWRAGRWEWLTAELGVAQIQMPDFHAWLATSPRSWMVVRRLFGLMPLNVPLGGDPDDYRPWSRPELCAALGIDEKTLAAELEAVRGGWMAKDAQAQSSKLKAQKESNRVDPVPQSELLVTDEELLREFAFPEGLFASADQAEARADRAWFCNRVREWERLLRDRNASRLAVQVLIKDLRLRRANVQLVRHELRSHEDHESERKRLAAVRELNTTIRDLEESYQQQIEALQELAPWFNVTGRQMTVTGSIGELVQAIQEYEARGDSRLIDGVFTALEIQVMTRTSQQVPQPQYRAGWVTYVNAARGWLWDPNARSQFKQADLARLDHAWKRAVELFNEETGEPLPDLESDGPEGEYAELVEGPGQTGNDQ